MVDFECKSIRRIHGQLLNKDSHIQRYFQASRFSDLKLYTNPYLPKPNLCKSIDWLKCAPVLYSTHKYIEDELLKIENRYPLKQISTYNSWQAELGNDRLDLTRCATNGEMRPYRKADLGLTYHVLYVTFTNDKTSMCAFIVTKH